MNIHTVITADIIGSRERKQLSAYLREKLQDLNREVQTAYSFTQLRGDEVQGVLAGHLPRKLPVVVRYLRYHLLPCRVRVGIGAGGIDRDENIDNPWELNGPAFHRAREAVKLLEAEAEQQTGVRTESGAVDKVMNSLWLLLDLRQSQWSDRQWQAIYAYEQEGTYKEAAAGLGIALQNVAKRCRAADWQQFQRAEKNMQEILDLFARGELIAVRGGD